MMRYVTAFVNQNTSSAFKTGFVFLNFGCGTMLILTLKKEGNSLGIYAYIYKS